jgi:hypothetical protein
MVSRRSEKLIVPPLFPMENSDDSIRDHIKKLTNPIFEAALKEKIPDSMTTIQPSFRYLWRPHNYRRQIRVREWFDSGYDALMSAINSSYFNPSGVKIAFNYNSRLKTLSIHGLYSNITLQLGRNTLVGIWKQNIVSGEKETYLLESKSFQDIEDWLYNKKKVIMDRLDLALRDFATKSSLLQPGEQPVWGRYEDWIKGDDYIDKIPRECIIHDTVFKKVYEEGVEFKGGKGDNPVVHMKNYIKNRSLEDFSPLLIKELEEIKLRLPEPIMTPEDNASWKAWSDYFYLNREKLGLDYSRVRF